MIVGTGELGPGGTGRSRFALELDELDSPGVVAELAWLCGLVRFELDRYRGRWIDTPPATRCPRSSWPQRYAEAVAARVGVRALEGDGTIDAARAHRARPGDPRARRSTSTSAPRTRRARSERRTPTHRGPPRRRALARDATRGRADPRPAPRRPHAPRRGPAPGGPRSRALRRPRRPDRDRRPDGARQPRLHRRGLRRRRSRTRGAARRGPPREGGQHAGRRAWAGWRRCGGCCSTTCSPSERQNDRVQESLGNVVAAHAVQTYLGSYGPMIHPVGACATAAVSLEVAHDKIRSGGALAVLAGGFDDLTPEGMLGFADMGATASSDELEAMGLEPREASRANDVRRAGFVEAQGGGAQLVVRGDVALRARPAGARRARLRGQLRRRPARLDPGRGAGRAGERAGARPGARSATASTPTTSASSPSTTRRRR